MVVAYDVVKYAHHSHTVSHRGAWVSSIHGGAMVQHAVLADGAGDALLHFRT
jgi:hypothetical protein